MYYMKTITNLSMYIVYYMCVQYLNSSNYSTGLRA